MKVFEQIASWLGYDLLQTQTAQLVEKLQIALERTHRFKRSGRYDEALAELDAALSIAAEIPNPALPVAIQLHRADVLTRQGSYADATALLTKLEQDAATQQQETQLAYVEIGRGVLLQEQRAWDEALSHYEKALTLSKEANALGAEGRAQGHMADVYLHEGNASYAAHLLQEALSKLQMSGDMEMSSYFVGLLGQAMIENGKTPEGQELLGRALRIAEHMEYRQFELLWRQALAIEAMKVNAFEEARRHLLLVLANISIGTKTIDSVLTLCRLCKVCARLGMKDAALDYGTQAVEELGDESPLDSRLMAHAVYGVALRMSGAFEDAIAHLSLADQDYQSLKVTEAEYSYPELLRNLGAAYTELDQPEAARAAYERALAFADRYNLQTDLAGTHRDFGIFHMRQGDYSEAVQSWMTALRLYESASNHAQVARLHCDIANVRRQLGQSKRAIKDYEQALMLLGSVDDAETRGIVLSNAATAYVDHGDVATAEAFFIESIQIAQKLEDRPAEATRRGNYGWFLLSTGRAEAALDMLDYALRQSDHLGLTLTAAVQTDNLGLAYDELRDHGKAIDHHQRALERLGEGDNAYWRAMLRANLGHSLLSAGRMDEARELFDDAAIVGRTLNRGELIVRGVNGKLRLALHDQANAETLDALAKESVSVAEWHGARRLLADALLLQSEVYARQGQATEAAQAWTNAASLLETLRLNPADYQPEWMK